MSEEDRRRKAERDAEAARAQVQKTLDDMERETEALLKKMLEADKTDKAKRNTKP